VPSPLFEGKDFRPNFPTPLYVFVGIGLFMGKLRVSGTLEKGNPPNEKETHVLKKPHSSLLKQVIVRQGLTPPFEQRKGLQRYHVGRNLII
jgi:hypothetical protein